MMNRFQHSGFKVDFFPIICTMDWLPHTCLLPYYFYIAILRLHTKQTIDYSSVLPLILESNDHVSYLVFAFLLYFYVCFTLTYLNSLRAVGFPLSDAHSPPLFNLAKNTILVYAYIYNSLRTIKKLVIPRRPFILLLKQ